MEDWKNTSSKNLTKTVNNKKHLEQWVNVVGGEGFYEISSFGRLRTVGRTYITKRDGFNLRVTVTARIRKQTLNHKGYPRCDMFINKKQTITTIHRLVAKAFHPNPANKREVNHKDTIKTNNFYLNLEWATPSENIQHSFANGTHKPKYGKEHQGARAVVQLTINNEYVNTYDTGKDAFLKTKIGRGNICNCCRGKKSVAGGFKWMYLSDYERQKPQESSPTTAPVQG